MFSNICCPQKCVIFQTHDMGTIVFFLPTGKFVGNTERDHVRVRENCFGSCTRRWMHWWIVFILHADPCCREGCCRPRWSDHGRIWQVYPRVSRRPQASPWWLQASRERSYHSVAPQPCWPRETFSARSNDWRAKVACHQKINPRQL